MGKISGVSTTIINNIDGFYTTSGGGGTATTTPTISADSSILYGNTITVTNSGSYTEPVFHYHVSDGTTTIVDVYSQEFSHSFQDTEDASTGTRTITVSAQEYGDFVESADATTTYTKSTVNYRYYRLYGSADGTTYSSGWHGTRQLFAYSSVQQGGTQYPEYLTSATSGNANGYYTDYTYEFNSTYAGWKAFDNTDNTWHWTLSVPTAADNHIGFYFDATTFPTAPTVKSWKYSSYSDPTANYTILVGSNTGAFAGEESVVYTFDLTAQSAPSTIYNIG